MVYIIKNFFKKIKQLIDFAPIVWKHEDWDYTYILTFNIFLLERLRSSVFEKGLHLPAKHDERKLKTVIELLKRISDDEKYYEELSLLYNKYVQGGLSLENINQPKPDRLTRELSYFRAKAKQKQELEQQLLFKLLKTQGRKWWD